MVTHQEKETAVLCVSLVCLVWFSETGSILVPLADPELTVWTRFTLCFLLNASEVLGLQVCTSVPVQRADLYFLSMYQNCQRPSRELTCLYFSEHLEHCWLWLL